MQLFIDAQHIINIVDSKPVLREPDLPEIMFAISRLPVAVYLMAEIHDDILPDFVVLLRKLRLTSFREVIATGNIDRRLFVANRINPLEIAIWMTAYREFTDGFLDDNSELIIMSKDMIKTNDRCIRIKAWSDVIKQLSALRKGAGY